MRKTGTIEERKRADVFRDFLRANDVACQIEPDPDGGWAVWVIDEDQVESAREMLEKFRRAETIVDFRRAAAEGKRKRREEEQQRRRASKNFIDMRRFYRGSRVGSGPAVLTALLVAASVGVTIFSNFGRNTAAVRPLLISGFVVQGSLLGRMPEVMRGEVWRLVTPMFIHLFVLHLLFNMMWLFDLGTKIERRHGSLALLGLVLLASAAGNLSQLAVAGPEFGGMSGVVYGLLAYIWVRNKYDPAYELGLRKQVIVMMLVWFFLCFLPGMRVANAAHAGGLLTGAAVGFVTSGKLRRMLSREPR